MKTALICVLIAGLMPYLWTTVAKIAGPRYDNRNVREWQSKLTGLAQRAHAAHLNSFEAFPFFAAAVLAAIVAGVEGHNIAKLALTFVGARLLCGLAYLSNKSTLRSAIWFASLSSSIALRILAVKAASN